MSLLMKEYLREPSSYFLCVQFSSFNNNNSAVLSGESSVPVNQQCRRCSMLRRTMERINIYLSLTATGT